MNCPICHQPLHKENRTWKCPNNHAFDQARQGYVNLCRKQKVTGDNEAMSAARTRFLESGAYDFLREAIAKKIHDLHPRMHIDLGCGEGYYTRRFAKEVEDGYGIDLSRPSIAHAAGQDKQTQYIVGSIFELPFADQSADLLTSIFTPIPAKEARRVLKEDGLLITVGPGKSHHKELKEVLYENVRLNDEPKQPEGFELVDRTELSELVHVDDVWSLLEMTPYRYKSPAEGLERVKNLKNGLDVTFDFVISTWRKAK